jgi:succinate dehydrogenase (ubiquinone) iron-sulfur subunit
VSGKNGLAGLLYIEPDANAIEIQPLPHSYVVTDLVPDLTNFYNQYKSIEPWLEEGRDRVLPERIGPIQARRHV